jgi:signal transduction histidine kinase
MELVDLLSIHELGELIGSFAGAHRCRIAIRDRYGVELATSHPSGCNGSPIPILHEGQPLGWVVVDGGPVEIAGHIVEVLDVILHHALARRLADVAHEAVVSNAFAEVSLKNRSLESAMQRMQDADRVKTNFLSTISHELRTPLTSVIGYSEMLLEGLVGPLSDRQCEYMATILAKANQLLQLITTMLDMSRVETRQPLADTAPVALVDVIDSVVASFLSQADKRGIAIVATIDHRLRARGDRRQIHQVVWSLVSNAVKFTPDGGHITIRLHSGPLDPGGPGGEAPRDVRPSALIEVVDNGIGIPADQVHRIFEPFFQVDSSSTREYGGSGLGLALAKAYVEAHGGRLWVNSTPGQGSAFVASFPLADEARVGLETVDEAQVQ